MAIRERPILMTGPLVVATLDDRKTNTRRVIVPQPEYSSLLEGGGWIWNNGRVMLGASDGLFQAEMIKHCPYGGVGDRLWVRETFAIVPATAYRASAGVCQTINPSDHDDAVIYRATWDRSNPGTRWRPSIHMPRWASRLTLEITDVRVERVQDITPRAVVTEGLYQEPGEWGPDEAYDHLIKGFAHLWDQINAKRIGCSWQDNPWVWSIHYKPIAQTATNGV